jgi:muramoyltetrapeptide carboxypeptidase LdcA involved in peptidoglycan recycling
VLGAFNVPPTTRATLPDRALDEIWRENVAGLGVPVVRRIHAGHVEGKRTLPLGGRAEIDTERRLLRLVPEPVRTRRP